MITNKTFNIQNKNGEKISILIQYPEKENAKQISVIFCHGMASSKDGIKQQAISENLLKCGFPCIRFDFSGCGESEGLIENTTISKRLDDLESVFRFVTSFGFSRFAAIGSSLGATICLLAIADKILENVESAVLIATPSNPAIIFENSLGQIIKNYKRNSFFELNGIKFKWDFFEDARKYNILDAASKINCSVMLIHGQNDEIVPLQSSMEIYDKLLCTKKLLIIERGDHSLSARENLNVIIKNSQEWICHGKEF